MSLEAQRLDNISTEFAVRNFSPEAAANLADISSLIVCSEKPDISAVERVLDDIVEEAPYEIACHLQPISELRRQWHRNAFRASYGPHVKYASDAAGKISWSPSQENQDRLKSKHLLSNDDITETSNWFDTFVKQVSAIRLCHVRHISKKGCDLNGERHFDAHLTPEGHVSHRSRVEAAMEVLSSANISLQAKQLLFQAIEKAEYRFQTTLNLHVLRPVKDYADHTNSFNFLTATYCKLLRDALGEVASTYFPTSDIRVHDEPVMMLTKTNRTDADSLGRIVKQPLFELGDVDGKFVIVADDHVNAGAFTTTLVSQAEANGANVVGVASFSRHPNSGNLLLKPTLKEALLTLHPQDEIDTLLSRVGVSIDTLTNREGLTLLSILMDGANDNHRDIFYSAMADVNGRYNHLLDGIGDDLECELIQPSKTPQDLLIEIDEMFQHGTVR